MEINEQLDLAIRSAIEDANALNGGTDEKIKATEAVKELIQTKVEYEKSLTEKNDSKRKEIMNWIGLGVQVGVPLIGYAFYGHWLKNAFHFEENGTVRSPMTRNLLQKILPKK